MNENTIVENKCLKKLNLKEEVENMLKSINLAKYRRKTS